VCVVSWLSYSSLVPPNLFILVAAIGLVVARWKKRFGLALAAVGIACLYLVSMPIVAALLVKSSEAIAGTFPALPSDTEPEAIVVLAADVRRSERIGEPDTVGPLTLERLAEAAKQQRRLGLPVLVSGGASGRHQPSLAALMTTALQEDFGLAARWQEDKSQNTFENASFSAAILRRAGVNAALVVAHSWDMARVLWSFRAVGYPVAPLAVSGTGPVPVSPPAFLPQVPALQQSYYALHEMIGLAWYRLRHSQ
jgi:uncharacterized SAM-binding protein YcdF (DUF218 family)